MAVCGPEEAEKARARSPVHSIRHPDLITSRAAASGALIFRRFFGRAMLIERTAAAILLDPMPAIGGVASQEPGAAGAKSEQRRWAQNKEPRRSGESARYRTSGAGAGEGAGSRQYQS